MKDPHPQSHPQAGNFKKSTKPVQESVFNITFPFSCLDALTVLTSIKTTNIETKAILYSLCLLVMYLPLFRYALPIFESIFHTLLQREKMRILKIKLYL